MVAETPNNGSRSILHFYLRSRVVTLQISFETGLSVCLGLYAMLRVNGGDLENTGASVVRAAGEIVEPEFVADMCVDAIREERFLILPHPEVLTFFQRKTSDYDRWLVGMRRLQARVLQG